MYREIALAQFSKTISTHDKSSCLVYPNRTDTTFKGKFDIKFLTQEFYGSASESALRITLDEMCNPSQLWLNPSDQNRFWSDRLETRTASARRAWVAHGGARTNWVAYYCFQADLNRTLEKPDWLQSYTWLSSPTSFTHWWYP